MYQRLADAKIEGNMGFVPHRSVESTKRKKIWRLLQVDREFWYSLGKIDRFSQS